MKRDPQGHVATRCMNVAGILLIGVPALNLVNLWPLNPSSSSWRFGAFGVTANNLLLPVVGMALLTAAAVWTSAPRWRFRAIAGLTGAAVIALLIALCLFALDALQERARVVELQARGVVQGAGLMNFQLNVAKAAAQALAAGLACGVISQSAWRGARHGATGEPARKGPDSLVVAATSTASGGD
ncbi:MAG: hypothetical protein PVI57_22135 [Gemmatimonadota bacterium]